MTYVVHPAARGGGLSDRQRGDLHRLDLLVAGGNRLTPEQQGVLWALRLMAGPDDRKRADAVLEKHRALTGRKTGTIQRRRTR